MKPHQTSVLALAASTLLTASSVIVSPINLFSGGSLTPPTIAATTAVSRNSQQSANKFLAQAVSNTQEAESPTTLNLDGEEVPGDFSNTQNKLPDGSSYNLYQFYGQAGQTINIEVSSDEVRPYLVLFQVTQSEDGETEYVPVAIGELDGKSPAQLMTELEADGTYIVLVANASEEETGNYTIKAIATS
jgi:hypothetical protein